MSTVASQITSLTIAYSIVYLIANQRKHQSFALLAFVRGIHQRPVDSPHKGSVTLKMFPFDDVIMWKLKVVTWRQLFHHRLHCRLTLSNPPVPRVTMKFSSWQFLVISVFLNKNKTCTCVWARSQPVREDETDCDCKLWNRITYHLGRGYLATGGFPWQRVRNEAFLCFFAGSLNKLHNKYSIFWRFETHSVHVTPLKCVMNPRIHTLYQP